MGNVGIAGLIIAGLVTIASTVVTFLLQGKKKWELEIYRNGNQELREQAKTHNDNRRRLEQENHGLKFKLEAREVQLIEKEKLIKELKDLARQVPAFARLSEQQREEHREVTAILGSVAERLADVAQGMTELAGEIRGRNNGAHRASTAQPTQK